MKISVCDDDISVVQQLHALLEEYFSSSGLEKPVIRAFSDGAQLAAEEEPGDIVFLDIEMPVLNGIDTAEAVYRRNKSALIIILTSYPGYLDDAMRVNVFRYLSKPIEKERLFRNLQDAIHICLTHSLNIVIETKEGVHNISAAEIIMIEKQGRKSLIYTEQKLYESSLTIQHYAAQLPVNSFYQTHKSFIVNMAHINDFNHDTVHLCAGKVMAYLTRRKYKDFKNAYLFYLSGTK